MSLSPLTPGVLLKICQSPHRLHGESVVQVIDHRAVADSGEERVWLLLNDGEFISRFCLLASQLNSMVQQGKIPPYTVIKIKKVAREQVMKEGQLCVAVKVLDLEVVREGGLVGRRIGDPVAIGSDGKVPDIDIDGIVFEVNSFKRRSFFDDQLSREGWKNYWRRMKLKEELSKL